MSHKIVDTRDRKLRLVMPVSKNLALLVFDDPFLIQDDSYAPGVMSSMKKAWNKHDYFEVVAFDNEGKLVEQVSSMAGYGGPKKAAEAALADYFSSLR